MKQQPTRGRRRWLHLPLAILLSATCAASAWAGGHHRRHSKSAHAEGSSGAVEGVAAYYAKRHEGKKTASGERYRAEKLTAAHPDAPLGSLLRVQNLETGKEVVVRVNDRCRRKRVPFVDLSRSAARELGFLGTGKARVRITRVEGEAGEPVVAELEAGEAQ
ncbi:MAG: septal ring lytic transglycosylase RlpA family protein [Deltaproteobacteria bacterium]|nr:septal ring lytic transglycosylase RlpA family protein [Deltaproteobacteria bacterium]